LAIITGTSRIKPQNTPGATAALCEQEVAQRLQSRISNWTHEARPPRGKSFATLALTELPQAAQKKIIALRDNTQWTNQADNVLLIGSSGVGKSHVAAALKLHLIEQGIRVKWISAMSKRTIRKHKYYLTSLHIAMKAEV
jgi:DNA replication protein DnaC